MKSPSTSAGTSNFTNFSILFFVFELLFLLSRFFFFCFDVREFFVKLFLSLSLFQFVEGFRCLLLVRFLSVAEHPVFQISPFEIEQFSSWLECRDAFAHDL